MLSHKNKKYFFNMVYDLRKQFIFYAKKTNLCRILYRSIARKHDFFSWDSENKIRLTSLTLLEGYCKMSYFLLETTCFIVLF